MSDGGGVLFTGVNETLKVRVRADEIILGEKSRVLGFLERVVVERRFHLKDIII